MRTTALPAAAVSKAGGPGAAGSSFSNQRISRVVIANLHGEDALLDRSAWEKASILPTFKKPSASASGDRNASALAENPGPSEASSARSIYTEIVPDATSQGWMIKAVLPALPRRRHGDPRGASLEAGGYGIGRVSKFSDHARSG